ncbi:MAG: 2,3-bisphosphoglycerate-dependent phosphoglycerate mutase [Candidatus Levybacteria bacterium CG_4_9_14_3_um_filter_35_16]|nr:MAG: 2,3-bisphosphoglycerate-dependent phosphoglycerate mutase [Candidatus Levybacteria bacterium CG22_combo_CG10-13_8_21_14_all_35_11]PJA91122.1 MAG: 2,3-bisphosphoglycerate-dependent phosphoglycerate mutase [Candidatus Levybacteria bacterium CG_4_9_14_3_um_filter_35_16]PJC54424.1 MAG: 2,3-bisphosphoglycerate-dependent phosphoglycerate mutase [Candidatus Levybacteria bacterium CG_4_9_14_0_2_um_filter_35_21]
MAKIFIFRHGQTTDNLSHTFSGFRDVDLTESGVEEAKTIGEQLKDEKVTRAYCSDQIRSKHTLELVLNVYHKDVPVLEDARIKERDYGDLTGKNKDEVAKEFPEQYPLWHRSFNVSPPGGESVEDVQKRVLPFLDELMSTVKEDETIFICAHGNSIRPMRMYFEGITPEEASSYEYTPGEIFYYSNEEEQT